MFLLSAIPFWGRILALLALVAALYGAGWIKGDEHGTEKLTAYQGQQAIATLKVIQGREKIVTQTETKYRDRIQTVYAQGETITKEIPAHVTPADDAAFPVPIGFVREYGAAWTGSPAGVAGEFDHQPSGVPLSEIAGDEANNATSCLIYKTQRDGLIEFYGRLKAQH